MKIKILLRIFGGGGGIFGKLHANIEDILEGFRKKKIFSQTRGNSTMFNVFVMQKQFTLNIFFQNLFDDCVLDKKRSWTLNIWKKKKPEYGKKTIYQNWRPVIFHLTLIHKKIPDFKKKTERNYAEVFGFG